MVDFVSLSNKILSTLPEDEQNYEKSISEVIKHVKTHLDDSNFNIENIVKRWIVNNKTQKNYRELREEGDKLFHLNDYSGALKNYNSALLAFPSSEFKSGIDRSEVNLNCSFTINVRIDFYHLFH